MRIEPVTVSLAGVSILSSGEWVDGLEHESRVFGSADQRSGKREVTTWLMEEKSSSSWLGMLRETCSQKQMHWIPQGKFEH